MTVVFRVDSSTEIGTGHVMRCLALADGLKKKGKNVEFICRKHKGNLIENIKGMGFSVTELEASEENKCDNKLTYSNFLGTTQQQDATECSNILQQIKPDWLIVDHYGIDEDWHKVLQRYYKKLMVIDDLADRRHKCDILLDQTYNRQEQDYIGLVQKQSTLLLGSQYALLRPEFLKWREYSLERRRNPKFKKLLITMGGIDSNNITEQVLIVLEKCSLPNNMEIMVVMGRVAPYIESVKAKASDLSCKVEVKVNVDNMAEIMANADMAIGASGSTTWERCCLGLPTIQLVIAKNQEFSAVALGDNNIVKLLKKVEEIPSFLINPEGWMAHISLASAQICDGMGIHRILSKIT
jgi:UDP-2,4-diacetamido-2,4,6-trideoxy-beta-L-altropyranose hydrolase